MTKEQRRREIREIARMVDQVAALTQYEITKVNEIQVVLAKFEGSRGCAPGGEWVPERTPRKPAKPGGLD